MSRSEREALSAIQVGHSTPVAAFLEAARKQESIFLGDIIFYSYLERLSGRTNALITWKDGTPVIAPTSERSREFVEGELLYAARTRGAGGASGLAANQQRTRWLGGVEIKPGKVGGAGTRRTVSSSGRNRHKTASRPAPAKNPNEKAQRKAITKKAQRKRAQRKRAPRRRAHRKAKEMTEKLLINGDTLTVDEAYGVAADRIA